MKKTITKSDSTTYRTTGTHHLWDILKLPHPYKYRSISKTVTVDCCTCNCERVAL